MSKKHEAVDVTSDPVKPLGMGDPSEADAAADRANDDAAGRSPRTVAELEAARKRDPVEYQPIEGTSAANIGRPGGGSHRCGNPMGYGTCDGEIDNNDPEARCKKCGIPSRAAIAANMPDLRVDLEGVRTENDEPGARIAELTGSIMGTRTAAEKEAARLALARAITRDYWAKAGVDPEGPAFNRTPGVPLDPKLVRMMKECEGLVTEAYKRCGLLPRLAA